MSLLPRVAAQDGGLDTSFRPTVSSGDQVHTIVPVNDGEILIGGNFTNAGIVGGSVPARGAAAKYGADGSLSSFAPAFNSAVFNIVAEPDSSALFVGTFATVNSTVRRKVARFLANETLDSFVLTASWGNNMVAQPSAVRHGSGYLFASQVGTFRLGSNGTDDSTFTKFGLEVHSVTLLDNDQFFVNGPFPATAGAVNSPFFEKLQVNGTGVSPAFSHPLNGRAYCSVVQRDNKILVGGSFTSPTPYLVRLNQDGTTDTAFAGFQTPDGSQTFLDGAVKSIAVQVDGKILIAGDFTKVRTPVRVNGIWEYAPRRGLARLHANGILDNTFDPQINAVSGSSPPLESVALQGDGKVLITGAFRFFDGVEQRYAARLNNGVGTQSLTYSEGVLRWERSGTLPEVRTVDFAYRAGNGSTWTHLGSATRETGTANWTRSGVSTIPAYSIIRASGRTTAGKYNGSTGIASFSVGYLVPRINLARVDPSEFLSHNGSTAIENVGVGRPRDFSFTLTNFGDGPMTGINTVLTGGNASMFSVVTAPPATLASGASAPVVVRFNPTSTGSKTTTFRINSNDPTYPAFNITLNGSAVTAIQGFRYEYFNTTSGTGNAADSADPDGDGHTNFFEFVAGLIPTDPASRFEQRVDRSSGTPQVIFSPRLADRTYEVQTSTTLNNDWVPAIGSAGDVGQERTFTHTGVTDDKRFYRVKITK